MNERYRSSAATGCDSDRTHAVQSVSESDLVRLLSICRSSIQPSMLVSLHPLNEGFEALESNQNTVVCVAIACFSFVFSDKFWLAAVWFIGLCFDAPCSSNLVLILFSTNTD